MEKSVIIPASVLALAESSPREFLVFAHLLSRAGPEGDAHTSVGGIGKALHLTVRQVRTSLERLQRAGLVDRRATSNRQVIAICNHAGYEFVPPQKNGKATSKRQAGDKQTAAGVSVLDTAERLRCEWNSRLPHLPEVKLLTPSRRSHIAARIKEYGDGTLDAFTAICGKINESDFLSGRGGKWKATFDWVVSSPDNWVKITEGNYANNRKNTYEASRTVGESDADFAARIIRKVAGSDPADGAGGITAEETLS